MAKMLGLTSNRCSVLGRVIGQPEIMEGWARMYLKTVVPENKDGQWVDKECIVPFMTNNPKTINTIKEFIQDERQLLVEGYVNGWQEQNGTFTCAIMITTIKLGSKRMYDPDVQQQNNQSQGGQMQGNQQSNMPGFPTG